MGKHSYGPSSAQYKNSGHERGWVTISRWSWSHTDQPKGTDRGEKELPQRKSLTKGAISKGQLLKPQGSSCPAPHGTSVVSPMALNTTDIFLLFYTVLCKQLQAPPSNQPYCSCIPFLLGNKGTARVTSRGSQGRCLLNCLFQPNGQASPTGSLPRCENLGSHWQGQGWDDSLINTRV